MTSPFRIGLSGCAGGHVTSTRDLLDFAERAEALGFDALWLNEEHFAAARDGSPGCLSPLILAAAIAGRTKRLRIGFSVLLMTLHQPVRLAEELATLDVLSNGRVDFGVSRGGNSTARAAFSIGTDSDFDTALDLILRAWRPGSTSLGGAEVSVEPKPLQSPHPPIFIGTYTEKTAEAAGRAGHSVICHGIAAPEKNESLIKAFKEGGGDPSRVPVGRFVYVSESDDKARRELLPTLQKLTDRLRSIAARRSSPNPKRSGVIPIEDLEPEAFYRRMVIAGSPQTCADKIGEMHARLGTTYLNALSGFFRFLPEELLFSSLELLAHEVRPRLTSTSAISQSSTDSRTSGRE